VGKQKNKAIFDKELILNILHATRIYDRILLKMFVRLFVWLSAWFKGNTMLARRKYKPQINSVLCLSDSLNYSCVEPSDFRQILFKKGRTMKFPSYVVATLMGLTSCFPIVFSTLLKTSIECICYTLVDIKPLAIVIYMTK